MSALQKIIESITKFINKYLMKSDDEYLELRYGVAVIVINFLKIMAVIITAFILGIGKYMLFYFAAFVSLRMFAFGVHASKSIICTCLNFLIFIGGTYLALALNINNYFVVAIFLIIILVIYIYMLLHQLRKDQ